MLHNSAMPGPLTPRHKGTVCGDDIYLYLIRAKSFACSALFSGGRKHLPIAEMAPPRPRTGFVALFAVVTITGATIFFVHRQQTQERQVTLPRVFALSLVYSQLCVCAHTDDAPSRAA